MVVPAYSAPMVSSENYRDGRGTGIDINGGFTSGASKINQAWEKQTGDCGPHLARK